MDSTRSLYKRVLSQSKRALPVAKYKSGSQLNRGGSKMPVGQVHGFMALYNLTKVPASPLT